VESKPGRVTTDLVLSMNSAPVTLAIPNFFVEISLTNRAIGVDHIWVFVVWIASVCRLFFHARSTFSCTLHNASKGQRASFSQNIRGGLVSQWRLLLTFYVVMQIFLLVSYMTTDWHAIGRTTMSRLAASSSRSLADAMAVVGDSGCDVCADEEDGTRTSSGGKLAANETTLLVSIT
jgi:hypothetical protein